MAAITHAVTLSTSTNLDIYTTGAFTPAANDLLYVTVAVNGTALTPTVTSSSGLTFTLVDSISSGTVSDTFTYVADALATAVSMTVSADITGDTGTGCFIAVERISGMTRTGASAKKQSKTGSSSDDTPAITFDASALTGNPTIGCIANIINPANLTEPTGWTELSDSGHTLPDMGLEVAGRDSGFTGTTITWGSAATATTDWVGVIAELDSSATSAGGSARRTRLLLMGCGT